MIRTLVQSFEKALARQGFSFFKSGDYNLNLIGVRNSNSRAGLFDDFMFCLYRSQGDWRIHCWSITTDPGSRLLQKPMNPEGTAILAAPQQMRGAYRIGLHKGRPALVQHGAAVKIWRDNDRDTELDWEKDTGDPGWYGINLHDCSAATDVADKNIAASAGCQVFAVRKEHQALMDLAHRSAALYGPSFTYTLLRTEDLQQPRSSTF